MILDLVELAVVAVVAEVLDALRSAAGVGGPDGEAEQDEGLGDRGYCVTALAKRSSRAADFR